jgi:hypothetical protein
MRSFFVSLLLCLAFLSPSRPAVAETEVPLPAGALERLSEEGWKPVTPGVMQRGLGSDKVETLGIGAEGRRFQLAQMKARLSSLREEYKLYPSQDLRKAIRSLRAEIHRVGAALKAGSAGRPSSSFEKLVATGTNCQASYDATADAYALSNAASSTASAFFKSACGDSGEVYVQTYTRGTAADDTVATQARNDPSTAPNTPRFGSDITAGASVTVNGVKDCYSTAYASVTSYDPEITYAVSDENRLCVSTPNAGDLLISEFRFRGANGTSDEFVELYNNTASTIHVGVGDGSAGWALAGSDGVTRSVVPNGTAIPPRAHYLATNTVGYSLGSYATGNVTYSAGIPDGSGIALFRTADPVNFTLANRLDAVGYSTAGSLYREGNGLPTGGAETSTDLNYSFYRNLAGGGTPADSNDNAVDFFGVDTQGTTLGTGQRLGAPGPENLSSPIQRNGEIATLLLDPAACQGCAPNRVSATPSTEHPYNTLTVRRRYTNNTGRTITRLRFRIVNVTTLYVAAGTADLRLRTSADTPVTLTNGTTLTVKGTTLENSSLQPVGGGWNSTAAVALPSQGLAPGASVDVQFVLQVAQGGTFRFLLNVEAD